MISENFERFHNANPHVYRILVDEARRWVDETGRPKVGIELLYCRARWILAFQTVTDDYKLNDHFTAYYSRLIMLREGDLDGLFDTRRSEEADAWIAEYQHRIVWEGP